MSDKDNEKPGEKSSTVSRRTFLSQLLTALIVLLFAGSITQGIAGQCLGGAVGFKPEHWEVKVKVGSRPSLEDTFLGPSGHRYKVAFMDTEFQYLVKA